MSQNTKKRSYSTRANLMVAVGSALYFLVLVLALYVMDRQVYSAAKLEIIRDNFLEIFRLPDTLNEEARSALFTINEKVRQHDREKLRISLEKIVNGPTSMVHMSLVDETGHVIIDVDNPAKPAAMNTWDNNLFIREFSGRTSQNVSQARSHPDTTATVAGHLTGTYTSPVGVEGITRLTHRYRWYAAGLAVVWVLAWLVIYYYLLRPVRNVTMYLDLSRRGTPSLIPGAHGALERGYNDLAASALLQMVEEKLNVAARPDNQSAPGRRKDAIMAAMELAGDGFGARQLRVGLVGNQDGPVEDAEHYDWTSSRLSQPTLLPAFSCPANPDEPGLTVYEDGTGFTYHAPLADGCMQADCIYDERRGRSHDLHENLVRACDVLRSGFVAFQAYSEHLFRERSEANISLSRNMGHDLTNIIATSKLELMGIKRVLEGAAPGTSLTEPKASILAQSVRGLLESTRLMQEMVNIYRSFSYVKRPAYERRPLAPLVEDFLATFEPALSSQVKIERDFQPNMPSPIVEPRLLKLALFNVLQNALDAMKRMTDARAHTGLVKVSVLHVAEDNHFEIRVSDNGPGIRDESGRLLSPAEAQAIFEYGYSTKGESGEGLGLNWVRTIMTDFHDGGVRAENVPGGGARVVLWLNSMERKEARVGGKAGTVLP
jgi:signal transduction histidine kinase